MLPSSSLDSIRFLADQAPAVAVALAGLRSTTSVDEEAGHLAVLASTEDVAAVDQAVLALQALLRDPRSRRQRKPLKRLANDARRQRRVLDRFGRDPHRNALLGRSSTPAEQSWLVGYEATRTLLRPRVARPLRILVLHGLRQSAARLRDRLRKVDRALGDLVEFVYLDGPFPVDPALPHQRCWWVPEADNTVYRGWEDAVRTVDAHLPADGILGFSQGATLAGLMGALRADQLRFVLCVSGFASRATAHGMLTVPGSLTLPSLHVLGDRDTTVTNDRSLALAAVFDEPVICRHPGGHFAPDQLPLDALRTFFTPFLDAPPVASPLEDPRWTADLPLRIVREQLPTGPVLDQLLVDVRRAYPSAKNTDPHIVGPDALAHRVWMAAWEQAPEQVVAAMNEERSFRALAWLAVRARQELADAEGLVDAIAHRFADQIVADETAGALSPAAEAAPRTGSGMDQISGLGRAIALLWEPELPHPTAYAAYRRRIVVASRRTRAFRRRAKGQAPSPKPSAELSVEVVRPRPVPVVPCPLDELQPLLTFLETGDKAFAPAPFPRGTVMPDGRLDLCKQVVGPAGIGPLLDGLDGNAHVERLLLGNNVVGATGAARIAAFIANRNSHVRVWYLAGNELDADAIQPLCDALATAPEVEGLWLKRNPLGPAGAVPLAELLATDPPLLTLDLVNTGLLDAGVETLTPALLTNTRLRHLYVGTNGLGPLAAEGLAEVLRANRLTSLYVDCNRLGDAGVQALAVGLMENTSLTRLSLASNRIGPAGMAALADALRSHPSLAFLNLGWTRATDAVHEAGNQLGDEGAAVVAELLRANAVLSALDLSHNGISQDGLDLLTDALESNATLVDLRCAQRGGATNADRMARLRGRVGGNLVRRGLVADEVEAIRTPGPARDVLSVYRTAPMGG